MGAIIYCRARNRRMAEEILDIAAGEIIDELDHIILEEEESVVMSE